LVSIVSVPPLVPAVEDDALGAEDPVDGPGADEEPPGEALLPPLLPPPQAASATAATEASAAPRSAILTFTIILLMYSELVLWQPSDTSPG
jgi:hypothetical protein